jgi:hypothetical protein
MKATNKPGNRRLAPASGGRDRQRFVVADPHVVYYDAVLNSPWNQSDEGRLPSRDDWSTYRYAVKDIIVGIATHRYNRQTRRLEIRAYFIGEHPVFRELEPTKAMMIILCSQAYQSGGTMELFFEQGIPFDVRQLIEYHLGEQIPGHRRLISGELSRRLYAALSDFSPEMQARIEAEVPIELVCFNTYRGIWSSNHIKSLVQRGISLDWIFMSRPSPLRTPAIYAHLLSHLCAAITEEYALHRLANRKLGSSAGKQIVRTDEDGETYYTSDYTLEIPDPQVRSHFETDSFVRLERRERFYLVPIVPHSSHSIYYTLDRDLTRAKEKAHIGKPILVAPLDFIYLPDVARNSYRAAVEQASFFLLVIGLTMSQLLAEVEFKLTVTAAQIDDSEVESFNVDRYAD